MGRLNVAIHETMPYQRAFSTLGCPELGLNEVLALAARHGLPAVELRALGGLLDLPAWCEKHFSSPAELAAALRGSPVMVAALDTSFKLAEPTDESQFTLLQFVPWADALGVPYLRVFDGSVTSDDERRIEKIAATIAWWRKLRSQNRWSVDLMVETHDALTTTLSVQRLIAVVPDVAILWDAHHTWRIGGEDPLATWRALRRHIVWIHLKDSISRPSAKHSHTYVLPGLGEFPAVPLVKALRSEFSGTVSLEWEKLWHPYLPPLEDALIEAARIGWW